jgi:hypothetical protein
MKSETTILTCLTVDSKQLTDIVVNSIGEKLPSIVRLERRYENKGMNRYDLDRISKVELK